MKNRRSQIFLFFLTVLFYSCVSNEKNIFIPDNEYVNENKNKINMDIIVDTKAGKEIGNMPEWLLMYLDGGIKKAETIASFHGKYLFVAKNEGNNFNALGKWAENYNVQNNFPMSAASRIEKRLISGASQYPDDEYGSFFEILVKKAYNAEYKSAVIEDFFWIKTLNDGMENYIFFILASMEKIKMQEIIIKMAAEAGKGANSNSKQNAAIRNIQQNFFEGF